MVSRVFVVILTVFSFLFVSSTFSEELKEGGSIDIKEPSVEVASEVKVSADKVIVGLLKTKKELYEKELEFSHNIVEMLEKLGAEVVVIDYNQIVDFKKIGSEALEEAEKLARESGESDPPLQQTRLSVDEIEAQKIKNQVFDFIRLSKINRIFIPGNYYNLDSEPYAPYPNRQLVTDAIVSIVNDNPEIHLIGVCGGLQGIMYSAGAEIIRVSKLIKSKEGVDLHTISMPDPHKENVHLHKLKVVPGSRLGSIISKHVEPDDNGWLPIFFPDAHGGVVNNTPENKKRLNDMGYKITGFSDDGIIEVIEDKFGNIYFQDHPESLAINILRDGVQDDEDKNRTAASEAAVDIMKDFLYRKDYPAIANVK